MGRRGPPPKPTKLKLAADNPGRRPLNTAEPKPEQSGGSAPAWLGDDARKLWFQIAEPMTRCGLATRVDEFALGRYCSLLAIWIRALKEIESKKVTAYATKNRHGTVVGHREHPSFAELRRIGPQLTALEREFGLTPASRTRIRLERDDRMGKDSDEAVRAFFLGAAPAQGA